MRKTADHVRDVKLPKEQPDGKLHQLEDIGKILDRYKEEMEFHRQEILFIEGNDHYSNFIRRALIYEGYDVEMISDKKEAYSYYLKYHPRMILIDLSRPDNWQLLKKIQQQKNSVPIIALTTHDDADLHKEIQNIEIAGVVTKPFVPAEFISTIHKHWKTTP